MTRNVHLPLILALATLGVGLWSSNAIAQIECTNRDTIGCDIDPETGRWIVRGSAPRKQDKAKPREQNAPCWNGLNIPASQCPARPAPTRVEVVVLCWNGQRVSQSECPLEPSSSRWATAHRATIDAWTKRQGLPHEHLALLDQLLVEQAEAMQTASNNNRGMLYSASERGYAAGIGYWEVGQEAFADNRRPDAELAIARAVDILTQTASNDPVTDYGRLARGTLYEWYRDWGQGRPNAFVPERLRQHASQNQAWYLDAWSKEGWDVTGRVRAEEIAKLVHARAEEDRKRQQAVEASAAKLARTPPPAPTSECQRETADPAADVLRYRQQIAANPADPILPFYLANALRDAGQNKAALVEYEIAIARDPSNKNNIVFNRGQAFANLGRLEEAFADIDHSDRQPQHLPALHEAVQARAAVAKRDYATAIRHLEEMNKLAPLDQFGKIELAEAYWHGGRTADAIAKANEAAAASQSSLVSDERDRFVKRIKCASAATAR